MRSRRHILGVVTTVNTMVKTMPAHGTASCPASMPPRMWGQGTAYLRSTAGVVQDRTALPRGSSHCPLHRCKARRLHQCQNKARQFRAQGGPYRRVTPLTTSHQQVWDNWIIVRRAPIAERGVSWTDLLRILEASAPFDSNETLASTSVEEPSRSSPSLHRCIRRYSALLIVRTPCSVIKLRSDP
jgi:hypothetical protein